MNKKPFLLRVLAGLTIAFIVLCGVLPTFAIELSDESFVIIPEADDGNPEEKSRELGKVDTEKDLRDEYNDFAEELDEVDNAVGAQIKSGIISWNFILGLLQQIVKFVANAALIVGALTIIYAGYLYASAVYTGASAAKAQTAIKRAVVGVVIVIFAYAILKIVVNAFL